MLSRPGRIEARTLSWAAVTELGAFLLPAAAAAGSAAALLLGHYPGCEAIVRLSERIAGRAAAGPRRRPPSRAAEPPRASAPGRRPPDRPRARPAPAAARLPRPQPAIRGALVRRHGAESDRAISSPRAIARRSEQMNTRTAVHRRQSLVVVAVVLLSIVLSGGERRRTSTATERRQPAGDERRPARRRHGRRRKPPSRSRRGADDRRPRTANRSAASPKLEYTPGEQIRFKVGSDVADEVHVHGYDLMKDVAGRRHGQLRLPGRNRRDLRGRARGPRRADRGAAGQPVSFAAASRTRWPPGRTCRSLPGCSPGGPRSS